MIESSISLHLILQEVCTLNINRKRKTETYIDPCLGVNLTTESRDFTEFFQHDGLLTE